MSKGPASYRAAGVDIAAGERAVELIQARVANATRPEVIGGLGGFAGLFELDLTRWRRPVLATSTDGVGTKLAIAQALGVHDTVGLDLVAMVVDDLVVCGAEPLFMTDYIACGRVVPERIAEIVAGIAAGCQIAGAALIGGETAEHPGTMGVEDYDLAGAAVGVVEYKDLLGADRVRLGDGIVALGSSGLHANGYSLARAVLLERAGLELSAQPEELAGQHLGAALLTPTRIYAQDCLELAKAVAVHAFAHVTGGGLAANLARVLPPHLDAVLDRSTWTPQPVFELIARLGEVAREEMESTFNQGVGMVGVLAATEVDLALRVLNERGVPCWVIGEVVAGSGQARLVGAHQLRAAGSSSSR